MGDPFVGIVHPSKVYNFLAAERPFVFIGPERSHVPDLIRAAGLGGLASIFRHGESQALAADLRHRAAGSVPKWPTDLLTPWTEAPIMEKIISLIETPRPKT